MTVTAQHVRGTLDAYLGQHPQDKAGLVGLVDVLCQVGDAIASRSTAPGHVTAGAVLLRADGRVLHIEHRALSTWLLPGGHVEPEDASLAAAALRELAEETGIDPARVERIGDVPLHIGAHVIPAIPAKGEAEHWHYDFRFLFRGRPAVAGLQVEEVTDHAWLPVGDIASPELRSRVLAALL